MAKMLKKDRDVLTELFDDVMDRFLDVSKMMGAVESDKEAGIVVMGFSLGVGVMLMQEYDENDAVSFSNQWQQGYQDKYIKRLKESK